MGKDELSVHATSNFAASSKLLLSLTVPGWCQKRRNCERNVDHSTAEPHAMSETPTDEPWLLSNGHRERPWGSKPNKNKNCLHSPAFSNQPSISSRLPETECRIKPDRKGLAPQISRGRLPGSPSFPLRIICSESFPSPVAYHFTVPGSPSDIQSTCKYNGTLLQ